MVCGDEIHQFNPHFHSAAHDQMLFSVMQVSSDGMFMVEVLAEDRQLRCTIEIWGWAGWGGSSFGASPATFPG